MLVAFTFFAAYPGAVSATDIHTWRDAQGRVHFGDRPPVDVASEPVTVRPNVYASPNVEALAEIFATESVVLYSAQWCGHCKRARAYFEANGIAFEEYDVETTARGRRDYARLGARGVPVILVGDRRMNGFSPEAFDRLYASQPAR